jgi:hypothetical protein
MKEYLLIPFYRWWAALMIWFADTFRQEKCTVIESLRGEVKLIKRSYQSGPRLVTLSFPSLRDCLEYADKNRFQINIMYSVRKKREIEAG